MNAQHGIIKLLMIIILALTLSGCLLLMCNGPTSFEPQVKQTTKIAHSCPAARVYAMRGFLDIFSTGMDTLVYKIRRDFPALETKSLSYLEEKRLRTHLISSYKNDQCKTPIILIGHSFGADQEISLAKHLNEAQIPITLLISLDHTKPQTIPPNVATFYNINSGQSLLNTVIPWGCSMACKHPRTRIITVDLVKDQGLRQVNHFNIDKLTKVHDYILALIHKELTYHP